MATNLKEIKEAVKDYFKWSSDYGEFGMLSDYRRNPRLVNLMWCEKINVNRQDNTITQNGAIIAHFQVRYAKHKRNGCYRELMPKITWVHPDA